MKILHMVYDGKVIENSECRALLEKEGKERIEKNLGIQIKSIELEDTVVFIMVDKEVSKKHRFNILNLGYFKCGESMSDKNCETYRIAAKRVIDKNNFPYENSIVLSEIVERFNTKTF